MEENVGEYDKIARIAVGAILGLVSLGILAGVTDQFVEIPEIVSPVLGVLSIVLLATGFMGKCYFYDLVGMDTKE